MAFLILTRVAFVLGILALWTLAGWGFWWALMTLPGWWAERTRRRILAAGRARPTPTRRVA